MRNLHESSRLLPGLFLLALCWAPLTQADCNPSSELDVLIPLAEGNRWDYRFAATGQTGQSAVTGTLAVDGQRWYRYQELGDVFWLRNDGTTQLEALGAAGNQNPSPATMRGDTVFRHPSVAPPQYATEFGIIQYQACAEPLTVPAGSFACHRYRIPLGPDAHSITWYALGIGMLRSELVANGRETVTELTGCQLQ